VNILSVNIPALVQPKSIVPIALAVAAKLFGEPGDACNPPLWSFPEILGKLGLDIV
jgi:hypothetical protein